jgi:hypothetical protein
MARSPLWRTAFTENCALSSGVHRKISGCGGTKTPWRRENIGNWKLKEAVAESAFFMQMVSPSAVKSPYCRFELDSFMEREKELGRDDLIFPILYISVPELDDKRKDDDPVLSVISEREYVDWRKIRHAPATSPEVRQTVERFCNTISKKLREPSISSEDRKRLEEDGSAQERQTGGKGHEASISGDRKAKSRSIFSRFALSLLPSRQWLTRRNLVVCGLILALGAYVVLGVTHWLSIRDSMDPTDYQRHLSIYPWGPFVSRARGRLTGLDEKDTLLRTRAIADLQDFIKKYPDSLYRPFADLRLNRLQTATSGKNFTPVLWPESSRRLIKPEEIQSLGCRPLWRARNEIFYAVGYCFSTQDAIQTNSGGMSLRQLQALQRFSTARTGRLEQDRVR